MCERGDGVVQPAAYERVLFSFFCIFLFRLCCCVCSHSHLPIVYLLLLLPCCFFISYMPRSFYFVDKILGFLGVFASVDGWAYLGDITIVICGCCMR